MGRKNKSRYHKSLHQLVHERLQSMQAFGQSKRAAMIAGEDKGKIFSFATYQTYKKHIGYYLKWLHREHPEVTTLKAARRYAREWLEMRADQRDDQGRYLSSWTIQTEAAALNKLFQIDRADPDRFIPPVRRREDIMRSRMTTARDKHFSVSIRMLSADLSSLPTIILRRFLFTNETRKSVPDQSFALSHHTNSSWGATLVSFLMHLPRLLHCYDTGKSDLYQVKPTALF